MCPSSSVPVQKLDMAWRPQSTLTNPPWESWYYDKYKLKVHMSASFDSTLRQPWVLPWSIISHVKILSVCLNIVRKNRYWQKVARKILTKGIFLATFCQYLFFQFCQKKDIDKRWLERYHNGSWLSKAVSPVSSPSPSLTGCICCSTNLKTHHNFHLCPHQIQ